MAFLLPLNFIAFSVFRERGLVLPAIVPRMALLFFESVFVAIICRPGATVGPRASALALSRQIYLDAAAVAGPARFRGRARSSAVSPAAVSQADRERFAVGAAGDLSCAFRWAQSAPRPRPTWRRLGLILVSSIIENTYFLAYHDELTTLPARRAFNDALLRLEEPYAVAVVDIDHFKSFNDTYGHETGDQVLRMVAGKLAAVTGGGRAYRVGGEEFSILFPGKSAKEVMPHLELLRSVIEVATFRVRDRPGAPGQRPARSRFHAMQDAAK